MEQTAYTVRYLDGRLIVNIKLSVTAFRDS